MATYFLGNQQPASAQRGAAENNSILRSLQQLKESEDRQRYYDYLMGAEDRKDDQFERVKETEREQFRLNLLQNVGIEDLKRRESLTQYNGLKELINANNAEMTNVSNALSNLGLQIDPAGKLDSTAINGIITQYGIDMKEDEDFANKKTAASGLLRDLQNIQESRQKLNASMAGVDGVVMNSVTGQILGFEYPTRLKDFYMNEFKLDPFNGQPLNRKQIPDVPDQEQVIEANKKVESIKPTLTNEEKKEADSKALGSEIMRTSGQTMGPEFFRQRTPQTLDQVGPSGMPDSALIDRDLVGPSGMPQDVVDAQNVFDKARRKEAIESSVQPYTGGAVSELDLAAEEWRKIKNELDATVDKDGNRGYISEPQGGDSLLGGITGAFRNLYNDPLYQKRRQLSRQQDAAYANWKNINDKLEAAATPAVEGNTLMRLDQLQQPVEDVSYLPSRSEFTPPDMEGYGPDGYPLPQSLPQSMMGPDFFRQPPQSLPQSMMGPDFFRQPFDPEGSGYDYSTAIANNLKPDAEGKWPSIVPETGQVLKGRNHPTFDQTIASEARLGNDIFKGTAAMGSDINDLTPYFSQPRNAPYPYLGQDVADNWEDQPNYIPTYNPLNPQMGPEYFRQSQPVAPMVNPENLSQLSPRSDMRLMEMNGNLMPAFTAPPVSSSGLMMNQDGTMEPGFNFLSTDEPLSTPPALRP